MKPLEQVSKVIGIGRDIKDKTQSVLQSLKVETDKLKELKSRIGEGSVESEKAQIADSLTYPPDRTSLDRILMINEEIINPVLEKTLLDLKKIDAGELKLERDEETEEKDVRKILQGLQSILPAKSESIGNLLEEDVQTLEQLDQVLSHLDQEEQQQMKALAMMIHAVEEMKRIIQQENRLIDRIGKKMLLGDKKKMVTELKGLISKEIIEQNSLLKDLGQISIEDEKGEVEKLNLFEDEVLNVSHELFLTCKQFLPVETRFQTGHYFVIRCNYQEFIGILITGTMSNVLSVYSKKLRVGIYSQECRYMDLSLDKVRSFDEKGNVLLVFPQEKALKKRVFQIRGDDYFLFEGHAENRDWKKMKKILEDSQEGMRKVLKRWLKEAEKLDSEFKKNFSSDAEDMMEKEFAKRWLASEGGEIKARFNMDIEELYVQFRLAAGGQGKSESRENLFREELRSMDMKSLKKTLGELKDYLESIEPDFCLLQESAMPSLADAVVLLPHHQLLYYEQYFEKYSRPDVFYYKDNALKEFSKHLTGNQDLKFKKTKIIDEDYEPLLRLE